MLNLESLNQAQRSAVMHGSGPLLVLAGPGSGKTYTITQRVFYLMEQVHVPPEQILVITFTKDAALSMQQRFIQLSDRTYPVHFATFHSIFYHIFKTSNQAEHFCESSLNLLTEHQKKSMLFPIMKKLLTREETAEMIDMNQEAAQILSAFSFFKNTGDRDKSILRVPEKWKDHFQEIFDQYERVRIAKGGLDFDDMVYECHRLLKNNISVREYWQNRFPYILMDEFQDINPAQYEVVKLLAGKGKNLFAVGDDDQSIYGFRGSDPVCLQNFLRDFDAEQILLNINYRSCPEIVEASGLVIADNQNRLSKHLTAFSERLNKGQDQSHNVSLKAQFFPERKGQDEYLLQQLKCKEPGETVGVLFRTNLFMQAFAAKLNMAGITYSTKEKTTGLFEHFIVKDIIAYLHMVIGEESREDLLRVMNKPSRFISRNALSLHQKVNLKTIYRFYLTHTEFPHRDEILQRIDRWDRQIMSMRKMSPFLAMRYLRNAVGYENYLKEKNKGNEPRWEEWKEILDWMTTEASHFSDIKDWVTYLTDSADRSGSTVDLRNKGKMEEDLHPEIMLMTVHASKGLEFDKVYIPECNEKMFPHGTLPDKEACEEERRIFYVAMTRARKSLELLCITGTKERPRLPSRFLNPLFREKKINLPRQ